MIGSIFTTLGRKVRKLVKRTLGFVKRYGTVTALNLTVVGVVLLMTASPALAYDGTAAPPAAADGVLGTVLAWIKNAARVGLIIGIALFGLKNIIPGGEQALSSVGVQIQQDYLFKAFVGTMLVLFATEIAESLLGLA
jgi:hypothetical protein